MAMLKVSLVVLCLMAITIFNLASAQNSQQDYINAHNRARAAVGVGNMVWDESVAAYARNYVNQLKASCKLKHSDSGGRYGENLAMGSPDLSGTGAVKLWVDERQYYNYNSNSCDSGRVCGHYTQVVWRNSVRLGCARAMCDNGRGFIVSCNYSPPGNFVNQKPY